MSGETRDATERLAECLPAEALTTHVDATGRARSCATPADLDQLRDVLAVARDAGPCRVIGCGSRLGWTTFHEDAAFFVSTRGLTGVIAYEPGDGTLTAWAGTPMSELAALAAGGGHHVTPDVSRPERSTLGGVLGAGASGIDRLRHGPARHNVLGVRAVLADGSVARSGGRLVKNVTGYDLHRLYCGSQGTLCMLVEATLRLVPSPEARAAVTRSFAAQGDALAAARAVLADEVLPLAVLVRTSTDAWELLVLLGGLESVVEAELERVARSVPEARVARGDDEQRLRLHARDARGPGEGPTLHLGLRPSRVAPVLDRLAGALASASLEAPITVQPGLAAVRVDFAAGATSAALARVHESMRSVPAQVAWRDAPIELVRWPRDVDAGARAVMGRLKRALDPDSVFAGGPLHGTT